MFQHSRAPSVAAPTEQGETEPERILKLKEITDLQVAAGYFRARLAVLSPWDRVVGGLVWAITASNTEVDVDIIFQENSTLGQRIKLADNIVRALVRMKCPHPLQSHQIQGLDYDHLFPVVRWLVRKVIETRQMTGDLVRLQSESQFSRSYSDFPLDVRSRDAENFVATVVQSTYKPKRLFKRKKGAAAGHLGRLVARAEATLLEYGEQFYRADVDEAEEESESGSKRGGAFSAKRASIAAQFGGSAATASEEKKKKALEAKKRAEAERQERLDALRGTLSAADADGDEDGAALTNFVDTGDISAFEAALQAQEEAERAAREAALDGGALPSGKRGMIMAFNRKADALRGRIGEAQRSVAEAREGLASRVATVAELRGRLASIGEAQEAMAAEIAEMEEQEKSHANKHLLAKLKALVMLNERLKKQEAQFKASCKAQLEELQAMTRNLEGEHAEDEETRRMLEIERIYAADLNKLNKLRKLLAKKNQEIAKLSRAIDEVPTRAELVQFERRFVELYELVAEKLVETRRYFNMYNTLEETYGFMENEVSLLESIASNFEESLKSKSGMAAFLESFQEIVSNIEGNIATVQAEYEREKAALDKVAARHKKLLDKQRKYFKAVKEFQVECYNNERLTQALASVQEG